MKIAAGILPYRLNSQNQVEVFLLHPGGPFFARRDTGTWSIPKGEVNPGEDMFAAAQREFSEETGQSFQGSTTPIELLPIKTTSGKRVYAWAVSMNFEPEQCHSNTFMVEWPPKSGKYHTYPEADKFSWFSLQTAALKITSSQLPFLNQLAALTHHSSATT